MRMWRPLLVTLALVVLFGSTASALEPGEASGTFTIDGTIAKLGFAVEGKKENLFDSSKEDRIIVLSDEPLGETSPEDTIGIALRAARGEITALTLRIDDTKLVNVGVSQQRLGTGEVLLPGQWFRFAEQQTLGKLELAKREWDGHSYGCAVEFAAARAAPRAEASPIVSPTETPEPTPTLPPASTSNLDPKSLTGLIVQAIMIKDIKQALKLIKLGADPNGRDQYGTPLLNWAVMMCQPPVVQALVDKKADLTYQRVPGMTILQEAGACPEAERILRAAGAK